jgi:Bacterial SH3 domain
MRRLLAVFALCQLFIATTGAGAEREYREVVISDPYIELHTGPGRGYPVFFIAERGEQIELLKQRTEWFKVRAERGEEGWVNREQLATTLNPDGEPFVLPGLSLDDYAARRWEVGALYGDFGGANAISAYGAFSVSSNLSLEFWVQEVLGRFSDSTLANINIVHTFFPSWRASPYFTLGAGAIHTVPKATLVGTVDRTDNFAHAGVGVRTYLTRRFVFRAEYKTYVVFTSRDDNEEIREWKAGFSFFF